mmetsp:Transcript_22318/g.47864  ORF Transcript_22318/g.47864 Transcript_22318/m.47864 type:complete len:109 (-) Transcript_22318:1263-1589(-)
MAGARARVRQVINAPVWCNTAGTRARCPLLSATFRPVLQVAHLRDHCARDTMRSLRPQLLTVGSASRLLRIPAELRFGMGMVPIYRATIPVPRQTQILPHCLREATRQ